MSKRLRAFLGDGAGELDRGRIRGQQLRRTAERVERAFGIADRPRGAAEHRERDRGATRIRGRIDTGERGVDELDRSLRRTGEVGRVGGLQQQVDVVDGSASGLVRESLAGRHRALVVRVRLGHREQGGHRIGGPDRRVQSLGPDAGFPPVSAKAPPRRAPGSVAPQLWMRAQRDGELVMVAGTFGRQQRVVDRGVEQRGADESATGHPR